MKISASPTTLQAGKDYVVTLTASSDTCSATAKLSDQLGTVVSSSTSEIKIAKAPTANSNDPCSMTLPVSISSDALAGAGTLVLQAKSANAANLATIPVKILSSNPVPAGPIPPGLTPPQVDMMWKVLPRGPVADSYGDRISDGFFAIEATFGNDTGYDLQIAALGFVQPAYQCDTTDPPSTSYSASSICRPSSSIDLKSGKLKKDSSYGVLTPVPRSTAEATSTTNPTADTKDTSTSVKTADTKAASTTTPTTGTKAKSTTNSSDPSDANPPIPVDAYPVVRSTVEREQSVGTRAIVVNLIKATGPTLVGVGGAFFDPTSAFSLTSNLFSAFFDKGIELVWPDLTTNHLINLDNRSLRDGAIIPNNSAIRINAFISRELVQCPPKASRFKLANRYSRADYYCKPGDTRLAYSRDFRPSDVMDHLGKLVLVGRKIDYINRIRVLQDANTTQANTPPLLAPNQLFVTNDDITHTLTLSGLHLEKASVAAPLLGVPLTNQKPSADGTTLSFDVNAKDIPVPSSYVLTVTSPYGVTNTTLTVTKKQ